MKTIPASPYALPTNRSAAANRLIRDTFLNYLESGATIEQAAHALLITPEEFQTWIRRDPEFEARVRIAHGNAVMQRLNIINNAKTKDGRPDWRAAAWWLKSFAPDLFPQKARRQSRVRAEAESTESPSASAESELMEAEDLQGEHGTDRPAAGADLPAGPGAAFQSFARASA